jgi:hypothetical protein
MDVKAKWEPGKEPLYPAKEGMTVKSGITKREYFALEIFKTFCHYNYHVPPHTPKFSSTELIKMALDTADSFLLVLNPEPQSRVQNIGPHATHTNSCSHEGELLFEKGKFLCMKCRNVVPKEIAMERAK